MTALEIFLLIIGVVLIFGSFFLTDKKNNNAVQQTGEINVEITQAQKHKIELQVGNIIDDTLKTSVDKTEAEFDKISNKKMTELSDYSENIINDINKNHNEVMFLYDMLGEKEKELKSILTEIDGTKKRVAELKEQSYAEVSKKAEDTSQFFNAKIMELKSEMENVVNAIEKAATEATEAIEEVKSRKDELTNTNIVSNEQKDSTDNKSDIIVSEDDKETSSLSDKDISSISEDKSDSLNNAISEDTDIAADTLLEDNTDDKGNSEEDIQINNETDSKNSDSEKSDIDKDNTVKEKEYKKSKNQVSRSSSRNNGRGAQKNQKGRKNSKDHRATRYGKYDNAISSEYAKKAENTTIEFDAGSNNNKQILELHSQGKTNIEIAKELGLGMGEVKLVIDLFRGGKR